MSVDYFAILELPYGASLQAVHAAWRRLVLLHHPDKARETQSNARNVADIHLINEARAVLSDPGRRAQYLESQNTPMVQRSTKADGPTIHQHLSLGDFTPHPMAEAAEYYTHPCRCSGTFTITHLQLEEGVEVIGCPGCGQWCRVGYEEAEDMDGPTEEEAV